MFIDSHAHLEGERFAADRAEVIARARAGGVEIIMEICNGDVTRGSLEAGVQLALEHSFIQAAVGIHPHDARLWDASIEARLRVLAQHAKVIAWGEIGLDYHYLHSPADVQRRVFVRQLELANELGLPVVIHTRAADADTIAILRAHVPVARGVFHCFSGGADLAAFALEQGFLISFAGNLTFKNAGALRDVARAVPRDRLLIETDSPFLAPVPHRGARNEPLFVREVARQLGELNGLSADEIGHITSANFRRFYEL
ncbi:MAG: TatD family hydrolase [Planctomycetota bacterium]